LSRRVLNISREEDSTTKVWLAFPTGCESFHVASRCSGRCGAGGQQGGISGTTGGFTPCPPRVMQRQGVFKQLPKLL